MTEPSDLPPPTPLPRGRPPAQRPTFGDLVLVALAIVTIQVGFALIGRLLAGRVRLPTDGTTENLTLLLLLLVGLQSLATIAAIQKLVLRRRGLSFSNLGLRPVPPEWRLRTAGIAVMSFALAILINLLVQSFVGQPLENPQVSMLTFDEAAPLNLLLMLLVVCGVVPFAEELLFRGLLFGWLRLHLGSLFAAGISGLLFAIVHGIPHLIPSLFALGVVLALLYERSRSLWPAIATHAAFNLMMLSLLYLSRAAGLDSPA